jgi:hypothetical protein
MPSSFFVNNGGTTAARSTIADDLTASSNSKSDAQKLAINAEDAQFTLSDGTTTGNSALHYSAKAAASATSASGSASTATQQAGLANDAKLDAQTAKAEAVVAFGDSVQLTGDQTIAGAKTFSGTVTADGLTVDGLQTINTSSSGVQPLLTLLQANNTIGNSWGIDFKRTTGSASEDLVAKIHANREGGDATGITFGINKADGSLIEAGKFDSSGRWLVGKTAQGLSTAGFEVEQTGQTSVTQSGASCIRLNRLSSDGDIIQLRKDTSQVGSIGTLSGFIYIGNGDCNLLFTGGTDQMLPVGTNGATKDGQIDLGSLGNRFDDIYATNGTIQTSDRNEKQDIAELSDAEQRVAVAAKGLLRKFRWKDAVAEKGDDARIHFGIIAQDLQDAFTAESLDAGRYAMFISSTWWETQTDVPAVEAVDEVLDEDGNVVTEAVEANEAYTRTDTYETLEKAPEGATERTRLGVRYSELLAFVISAI